jgi:K+-transporting ATPase KdpF subunit
MNLLYILSGVLAFAVCIYLLYAMIRPERF